MLISGVFFCFSLHSYAQEEEEGPKLTREAQEALGKAQEFYQNEDFAGARRPLLDFLATQPEVVPEILYEFLGTLWYQDEKLEEALRVFKEGYEAYPKNEKLLTNYATVAYQLEHYAEAARLFEKLYDTSETKDIEHLSNAASLYYMAEELNEAKRVFKRLIDLPGDTEEVRKKRKDWFNTIINICLEQNQMEEAEGYIWQALAVYPLDRNYWQFVINTRSEKEDYAGMASAYEIANRVQPPEKKKDWEDLADLYRFLNAPLREAKAREKALEIESAPSDEEYIKVADAYVRARHIDKAVSYLDNIISKKPTSKLLLEKGRLLYDARRNKEAIKALDECIALDPKMGEAYIMKGFIAWDLKDWKTAREAFNKAQISEDYRNQALEAMDVMDALQEERDALEKARSDFAAGKLTLEELLKI